MASPTITVRGGHPDFLDLPWGDPLQTWDIPSLVDLPKGISRHIVRFVATDLGIYAIKELPERPARNDYEVLRQLEGSSAPAVIPVGLVTHRSPDGHDEISAALITAYESFAFSYRELLAGPGFGPNRNRMLDAFAYLLVQLHLIGCYWGDCSLSNVLYRWDADTIETVMVDAETASLHREGLTDGRRQEDIDIMIENVAGGMADIAAQAGTTLDDADLALGEEIASRYADLWTELSDEIVVAADERYRIGERIQRINGLGFNVDEIDVIPTDDGGQIRFKLKIGGRTYHSERLRDLTGIDARENQARQILLDLYYYQTRQGSATPTMKNVSAIRWRVSEFEPTIARLAAVEGVRNPIQAFCDLLHHRYLMASELGRDVSTDEALPAWLEAGRPGYPAPGF
ncbi:MAG TPA: DUF4032 domain-containing protein [Acidimicrobiia bacterium]|nr:DUF4032 domain-containing protein [Acidimicrobiia bacterium]